MAKYGFYVGLLLRLRLYMLRALYRKFQHIWPTPYAHAQRPEFLPELPKEEGAAADAYGDSSNKWRSRQQVMASVQALGSAVAAVVSNLPECPRRRGAGIQCW